MYLPMNSTNSKFLFQFQLVLEKIGGTNFHNGLENAFCEDVEELISKNATLQKVVSSVAKLQPNITQQTICKFSGMKMEHYYNESINQTVISSLICLAIGFVLGLALFTLGKCCYICCCQKKKKIGDVIY